MQEADVLRRIEGVVRESSPGAWKGTFDGTRWSLLSGIYNATNAAGVRLGERIEAWLPPLWRLFAKRMQDETDTFNDWDVKSEKHLAYVHALEAKISSRLSGAAADSEAKMEAIRLDDGVVERGVESQRKQLNTTGVLGFWTRLLNATSAGIVRG